MTKTIIRLPTEQFAYIEQEVECATPEDAIDAYHALSKAYRGGDGLSPAGFNKVLDEYLLTGTIRDGSNLYAAMNTYQQGVLQAVKLSLKRIKSKQEPEIEHD